MQDLRKIADEFSTSATVNHTRIIIADTNAPLQTQLLWYGNETDHGAHIPLNFAFFGDIGRTSTPVSIRDRFLDMQDIMPFWGEPNWVLGNHDTSRVGYRFGEGRHESLAIFTLMMPGPAMIYYVRHKFTALFS